jgi:hypothetical protein
MTTSELDYTQQIMEIAQRIGFLAFHDQDSRRNNPGFPDIVLIGFGRAIILELKIPTGRLSTEQNAWIRAMAAAGLDVRVLRVTPTSIDALRVELTGIRTTAPEPARREQLACRQAVNAAIANRKIKSRKPPRGPRP